MRTDEPTQIYCPKCQRIIVAVNINRYLIGWDVGLYFPHDDVYHGELTELTAELITAMKNGLQ